MKHSDSLKLLSNVVPFFVTQMKSLTFLSAKLYTIVVLDEDFDIIPMSW